MYPLVREQAEGGIPVSVTCRVLKLACQPYYRWLAGPVTDPELVRVYGAARRIRAEQVIHLALLNGHLRWTSVAPGGTLDVSP